LRSEKPSGENFCPGPPLGPATEKSVSREEDVDEPVVDEA